ncbi:MAG: FkbM family methyltransferase [Flavisolibacter sp.]
MLQKIKSGIRKLLHKALKYQSYPFSSPLEKLGSAYGGWIIPVEWIQEHSICYLAGAGEDISFDIALATRFKCPVYIFDPTPKAKWHFDQVIAAATTGQSMQYNKTEQYQLTKDLGHYLHFFEKGLWEKKDVLRFFAPKDDTHVSHSISNLQETEKYFEAPVDRLSALMASNHHSHLDLLKMDIEGAEFKVIDTIIEDQLDIRVLCVEFHTNKEGHLDKVQEAVSKLENAGYRVVAREHLDFTFVKVRP